MKHLDEYRDGALVAPLAMRLKAAADRPVRIMEICGTHTMAIFRQGIRDLLPQGFSLISGPGCPVCVTPPGYIDAAAGLAKNRDVILCTFGDMLRVPGRRTSLAAEKADGADIRVLYSPLDAVGIAAGHPGKHVVFLGIGFETTAPVVALSVLEAAGRDLGNYSVFSAHKRVPPVLEALAGDPELRLDGFLCPGHVCTVTGLQPFRFLAERHGLPGAVAGFEASDILRALLWLTDMIRTGRPEVVNAYPRAVTESGNRRAQEVLRRVFADTDSVWRGLGSIPRSGLELRPEFARFDAARRFCPDVPDDAATDGCLCGEILKGRKTPPECGLYKTACTPASPRGACMVSTEGTCAAYYKYHNE